MSERLQDAFFRALFHSPLGGIAVADVTTATIIEINEVLLGILGCDRQDIVGVPHAWLHFTPPEYHHLDKKGLEEVLEHGRSEPFEKEYQQPSGKRVPVRISSSIVSGYPDRVIVFVTDITHERAALERERTIQQRLKIAISAANQGVWDYDLVTGEMIYSDRAKEIYGLPADQPVTFEQIRDATHPDDLPITSAQFRRAIDPSTRDRSSYEYRIIKPDGTVCWALAHGEAVFQGTAPNGQAVRYVGTIQDITDRKQAERQQSLLVAELNHRVKNMLAIVQSLAFQTMSGNGVPGHVVDSFTGRLQALASAHDLLAEEGWDGASIRDIALASLKPVAPELEKRICLKGQDLPLKPRVAVAISMAIYELATNAAKYGALSTREGRVQLSWAIEEGPKPYLAVRWRECGGPAVIAPSHEGFGTRMIRRVIGSNLRGKVDLTFPTTGAECIIQAPAAEVVQEIASEGTTEQAFNLIH